MKKIYNAAVSPVIYKDKFLLIKRVKPPYTGYWSLIGGKIEFGEHIDETIVREVWEETGMKVKFIAVRGVVIEHLKIKSKISDHFILWVCETVAKHSKAKEQNEGEVKWFSKEDLRKSKKTIVPSDYQMIRIFFLSSKKKSQVHKSHMSAKGSTYELDYFGNY